MGFLNYYFLHFLNVNTVGSLTIGTSEQIKIVPFKFQIEA